MANAPDSPVYPLPQNTPVESTPLLQGSTGIDEAPTEATAESRAVESQGSRLVRDVAIASWTHFTVSTVTLLLGVALGIMCAVAPRHFSVSVEMQRPLAILGLIVCYSSLYGLFTPIVHILQLQTSSMTQRRSLWKFSHWLTRYRLWLLSYSPA